MPADEEPDVPFKGTKSIKVTFDKSLPMGTRGTFVHEKQAWIAFPVKKNQQIHGTTVRLIGILEAIGRDLIQMLNANPGDAAHILAAMARINRVAELKKEITMDLVVAETS